MAIDSDHLQSWQAGGALVRGKDSLMGNAEFVALESGGNIRMGLRVHVRIDPDAHTRPSASGCRHLVKDFQFLLAFHVEAGNPRFECFPHFCFGLAYAGEDHLCGVGPGCYDTLQFTARDDIEATTGRCQQAQNAQRRIGLHGITDQVRAPCQSALVGGQGSQNGLHGIGKQRRAVAGSQFPHRNAVQAQLARTVRDVGMPW